MNTNAEKVATLESMIVWLAATVESGLSLGKDVAPLAADAERKARRITEIKCAD